MTAILNYLLSRPWLTQGSEFLLWTIAWFLFITALKLAEAFVISLYQSARIVWRQHKRQPHDPNRR